MLPGFVYKYLEKILHLKQVNYVLRNFGDLPPIEFIHSTLDHMGVRYHMAGLEKLDRKGRYIFASNHPFGGMDGMMLAEGISGYMGDVRVVVNDLLMNVGPLAPIFVPINKHGRQSSDSARLMREIYQSDMPILTFPAGLCSRRTKGVVCDSRWKPNFIKMAVEYKRDIVPVYVPGRLSDFFYRLANLRTRLGIKANIEMLYLVDQMWRQSGNEFEIVVGEPIPWQEFSGKGIKPADAAQMIKERVYSLNEEVNF